MCSQAIGTPIVEISCYYNHVIKVHISMEFLLCDQSVHFNKICSFFIIFLSCLFCWIKFHSTSKSINLKQLLYFLWYSNLVVMYVVQIPLVYGFYKTTHKWENLSCTSTYIVAMLQGKITCHIHYKKSGFRRRFKNVTKNPKNVTIDANGL